MNTVGNTLLHSQKRNIFSTDLLIPTLWLTCKFRRAWYSLIVLKVPLNPNQSVTNVLLFCISFVHFMCSVIINIIVNNIINCACVSIRSFWLEDQRQIYSSVTMLCSTSSSWFTRNARRKWVSYHWHWLFTVGHRQSADLESPWKRDGFVKVEFRYVWNAVCHIDHVSRET